MKFLPKKEVNFIPPILPTRDLGCLASKYSAVAAVSVWSMNRCLLGSMSTPPYAQAARQVPKITLDYACLKQHMRERDILKTKAIQSKDPKDCYVFKKARNCMNYEIC